MMKLKKKLDHAHWSKWPNALMIKKNDKKK
jgi:hypothetical protein